MLSSCSGFEGEIDCVEIGELVDQECDCGFVDSVEYILDDCLGWRWWWFWSGWNILVLLV